MSKNKKKFEKATKALKTPANPAPTSNSGEYTPIPIENLKSPLSSDSSEIFDFIPEIKGKKYY